MNSLIRNPGVNPSARATTKPATRANAIPSIAAPPKPQKLAPLRRLQVDADDAGRMLGLCGKTVRMLADAGDLPYRRVGRLLLFAIADLEKWVANGSPCAGYLARQAAKKQAKQ